jgi:hypothetical protein
MRTPSISGLSATPDLQLREVVGSPRVFELAWNSRSAAVASWEVGRVVVVLFVRQGDGGWQERQQFVAAGCDTPGTLLKGIASLILTKCPGALAEFCADGGAGLAITDIYTYLGCETVLSIASQPNSPMLVPGSNMGVYCTASACSTDIYIYSGVNGYPTTGEVSATWWEVYANGNTKELAQKVDQMLPLEYVAPNLYRSRDLIAPHTIPLPCPVQFIEIHYYLAFPNGAIYSASYGFLNQDAGSNGALACT